MTVPYLKPLPESPPSGGTPEAGSKPAAEAARRHPPLLAAFVDKSLARLKPSEAVVWVTLFRHAKDGLATVAQTWLARRTGLSVSSVERAIRVLKRRGLLVPLARGNNLSGRASTYRLRGIIREPGTEEEPVTGEGLNI